ncbi:MAG: DUF799 family lipoprotein [Deltaproteobacteria bacterium]|nr:DUF799 family lipoprotein [Deltaproteobacteria bacterium]
MTAARLPALIVAAQLTACAAAAPVDYAPFRAHEPRSILVLPPLNHTVDVKAPYSWLSTVTMPLAEEGYYVFPVAVVDAFLKENGLPTPGEMHGVPVQKLGEVFGADAVLYVTITDWGQKYQVISSNTVVAAEATLVDTRSALPIWQGKVSLVDSSGGSGNLIADMVIAAIEQIVDSSTDRAHPLSRTANYALLYNTERGLPFGARSPKYASDLRGRAR